MGLLKWCSLKNSLKATKNEGNFDNLRKWNKNFELIENMIIFWNKPDIYWFYGASRRNVANENIEDFVLGLMSINGIAFENTTRHKLIEKIWCFLWEAVNDKEIIFFEIIFSINSRHKNRIIIVLFVVPWIKKNIKTFLFISLNS